MKFANKTEMHKCGLALDPRDPNRAISISELLQIQNCATDSAAESQAGGGVSEENMPIINEAEPNGDQSAPRITPLTVDEVKRGDFVTYGTSRVMVVDRIGKNTVVLEDPFHAKGTYPIEVNREDFSAQVERASKDQVESEFQRVGMPLPPYFGRPAAERMKSLAIEDRKYLTAQIKKGLSGLICARRTTAAIRRNLGQWFSELAETYGGELKKAVAKFRKHHGASKTPSYTTVQSWVKFYHDFKDTPEDELPVTRDSARSANPAWTQVKKEAAPRTHAVAKKSGKRGRDEGHKAGDPKSEHVARAAKNRASKSNGAEASLEIIQNADKDIDNGQRKDTNGTADGHNGDDDPITTAPEPPTASDALLGLQTVILALKGLGIYSEYQEVLDRLRVALEQNATEQAPTVENQSGSGVREPLAHSLGQENAPTVGELSTEAPLRLCDQRPLPDEIDLPAERNRSETNSTPFIHGGKAYEVAKVSGVLSFRLSPEAGWTACSAELSQLIRDSQPMPEGDVAEPQVRSKELQELGEVI
jgi:hypothetical protein